jgi:DNA-binding cell septation regulator SpoVG
MSSVKNEAEKVKRVEARAYPILNPKGTVVGRADVTVDGVVAVKRIDILIGGKDGLYARMPQREAFKEDKLQYVDIVFPTNAELRKELNDVIVAEYREQASLPAAARGYKNKKIEGADAEIVNAEKKGNDKVSIDDVTVEARVTAFDNSEKHNALGLASVTVGDIAITGVTIVKGDESKGKDNFISMPQESYTKNNEKVYRDVAFPVSKELYEKISAVVFSQYDKEVNKMQSAESYKENIADAKAKAADKSGAKDKAKVADKEVKER